MSEPTASDAAPAPPGWPAPVADGPVDAEVRLPGSKSLTNRYLVLAALAEAPSVLRSPLRSRDTLLMAAAVRELGAEVSDAPGGSDWHVTPGALVGAGALDCGLAGTVMRFLPPRGGPGQRRHDLRRRRARPGPARWLPCWGRCATSGPWLTTAVAV